MSAQRPQKSFRLKAFHCTARGCKKRCSTPSGLQRHVQTIHKIPSALLPPSTLPPGLPGHHSERESAPSIQVNSPAHAASPHQSLRGSPPRCVSPPTSPRRQAPHHRHLKTLTHPIIDGTPCDKDGYDLPDGSDPPLIGEPVDFYPFENRAEFEFVEFLYSEVEMSAGKVDKLLELLAALYPERAPSMPDHKELYRLIDSIQQGDIPWDSFSPPWMDHTYEVWFRNPLHVLETQIRNPDFKDQMDYAPKRVFYKGKRRYQDLMSGNWAWEQADKIAEDESTHGAMFVPVILGSDKTTVSVATGQNDYYPLYISLGNVHNAVRRAHRNAVSLLAFLAIPKTTREYADKVNFRKFRRQLFHSSLGAILSPLHLHMSKPRITLCADGYYRRVIYGLGPYIADYPEQVLLACIVQNWCPKCTATPDDLDAIGAAPRTHAHTNVLVNTGGVKLQELWDDYGIVGDLIPFTMAFPRADIHELLAPDLLHQVIKGTFKDHVVTWVEDYINDNFVKAQAQRIMADIDRRIAVVPSFPGLRHFYQGRGFKQWTGNDSKGLMKVYLPAIAGHVPTKMVQSVSALINFCYLVRRNTIDEDTLAEIENALGRFHEHREIFRELGVLPDGFSIPRQHSITHYPFSITQFGAPNGLCSSITESKHIKAVKRPYRRSNRNKPLGQMLVTNQRLDKLVAARIYFASKGILDGPSVVGPLLDLVRSRYPDDSHSRPTSPTSNIIPPPPTRHVNHNEEMDEVGVIDDVVDEPESHSEISLAKTYVRKLPRDIYVLARRIGQQELPLLTRRFLYDYLHPQSQIPASHIPEDDLPQVPNNVYVYTSIRAVFYAPSDLSGLGGLRHERIRSTQSWYGGPPRRDCVFVGNRDLPDAPGMRGLLVARVLLFFSFVDQGSTKYPCALVHWFSIVGDDPCDETGMWIVKPDFRRGRPSLEVIHLDTILRGAHLIGVSGTHFLPNDLDFTFDKSLDAFSLFYVNKYVDHHAHEIAF
ncbi:hypothetical protein EDB84DRAFT_1540472 [Lactarius hengduanensis]|nr:hypothetical protein EDB84DRAFT_1540472 [Lactarius hengduanensis]